MTRTILIGAMLLAALTTGLSAQTPQTSGAGSKEPTSGSEIKMIGCLRSGDGSRDSKGQATAPVPAGASPSQFVLTDATTSSDANPRRGQAASAGATGSSTAATSYQLSGGNQDELRKYVNSKVEVLAILSTSPNSSPAPPSTGATSGATGTAGATGAGATATRETGTTATMPTLRVNSVRQLAGNCMP